LVTNNEDEEFDLTGCQAGMSVRWIGTAHPEMSEEGNVKSQSNMEVHRNYITRHRADVEYSSDFEAMEEVYITLGKSDSDTECIIFTKICFIKNKGNRCTPFTSR
jgi:hypothetical protein